MSPRGDDGRFYIHARCHPSSRLSAFVRPDGSLTLECAECQREVMPPMAGDVLAVDHPDDATANAQITLESSAGQT